MTECGRLSRPSTISRAFLLLAALSALSYGVTATDFTIGIIKGPSGLGASWMLASPPEAANWKIRFNLAASADLVVAKLVSGEIHGGILPVNLAAKLRNSGLDIGAAAVVGEGMVQFLTNDPSIRSIGDLRGKDIHVGGQKATPDYVFRTIASKAGLEAGKDFNTIYNLAFPEIAAQLASGKIGSAVLPEPFATQSRLLSPFLRSPFDIGRLWTEATGQASYPMTLLVLKRGFVESNPEATVALLRSYSDSIAKTIADPAGTGILAERLDLGMKAQVASASIPRSAYVYASAVEAKSAIESLLSTFLAFEPASIGGKLPDQGFYLQPPSPR
ncbi:MAG TPA: ABC transporter substrate-binding protein [Rectinemataceae bacterium]